MRTADIKRKTNETDIKLKINLDGTGKSNITTGCGFMDHMLTLLACHSKFDINIECKGDTYVDYHHSIEDIGICLGTAFAEALGNMKGINRYADIILPMDESLVMCAVDISGRRHLTFNVDIPTQKIGDFDTELVNEFMTAFSDNAKITLHFNKISGLNSHHIVEACFKALGRVLGKASRISGDDIPSSKGVL